MLLVNDVFLAAAERDLVRAAGESVNMFIKPVKHRLYPPVLRTVKPGYVSDVDSSCTMRQQDIFVQSPKILSHSSIFCN